MIPVDVVDIQLAMMFGYESAFFAVLFSMLFVSIIAPPPHSRALAMALFIAP